MDVEAQIADLDRRVSALEKTAKGQERHNARVTELLTELKEDVALLRRHAISSGQKIEQLEARVAAVETGLEGVRADVKGLRADITALPGILAETMREVLREGK